MAQPQETPPDPLVIVQSAIVRDVVEPGDLLAVGVYNIGSMTSPASQTNQRPQTKIFAAYKKTSTAAIYGLPGFQIHVFDGGRAFSHEEMIDAAFARFQYHGFRFSGNGSYDLAAAMPSEEVTEKTERALELVAALEGDELARFYH